MSRRSGINRLARLLRLPHQRPLSIAEICADLECSEKTADRYIRELRDDHRYPIEYDREMNGYRLVGESDGVEVIELPGLFFNESELVALLTMRELLASVEPGLFGRDLVPLGRLVEKLLAETGVEPTEVARRIRVVAIGTRSASERVFRICAHATIARRRLRIEYKARGHDGDWEQRVISPQRLVRYRDNWYLDAWCHTRDGVRMFALDQIRAAVVTDEAAHEMPQEELDRMVKPGYGIFSGEPEGHAVLRFSAHRAQWVSKEDWHGDQQSRFLPDGRYELTVPYAATEELLMDILKHGADVEVVAPPELRRRVAAILRSAVQQYRQDV